MGIDVIQSTIKIIIQVIVFLINLFLIPIDALISTFLPNVNNILNAISAFIHLLLQSIAWGMSISGLSQQTWALIAFLALFKISFTPLMWVMKLVLKWYHTLKP